MATSVTLKPNAIDISGSTSGTTTLQASAVAGTTTLTLPAATDTLVGKATTDTLTNKTLTGAAMNGTLGATTPSTASVTTLTTSSTVTHSGGTANGVAYLDGSKVLTTGSALVFDGTNLGLGVTPSAWNSSVKALQVNNAALASYTNSTNIQTWLANNAYYDNATGWLYKNSSVGSSLYAQNFNGAHSWSIAPSGTAGTAITFTQAMTLDASGNLGLAASSITPRDSGATTFELYGPSSGRAAIKFTNSTSGTGATDGMFLGYDSSLNFNIMNNEAGTIQFGTSNTERARIDSSGNLLVGVTNASQGGILRVVSASAEAGTIATFGYTANGSSVYILDARATGQNNSGTAMLVLKNTSTSRSISAAGTINASGADYAEYMTKAGNFTIAKGDVVGIDAQGNLTNVFDNAVSFMVKSTDPSYVGGDSWGSEEAIGLSMPKKPSQRQATEEVEAETDEEFAVRFAQYEADQSAFDAALEAARQRVDRIAFAGQVPVNVTGATAGQYIIPVNDNGAIKGEAVSNPTFEQYQTAVGKVIAIESDGRAKIIVKVA